MPKDKFKPKEFSDVERDSKKRTYVDYETRVERMDKDRPAPEEGEFARSPKDVREDYFSDEERAKEERGEPKPPKRRALKAPKRMIRKWDTRKAKRRSARG
jgi:hypothetical protein